MARKARGKIREREIGGLKYFDKLVPLLEQLHDDGCQRDKAGNRTLHFDQYCHGVTRHRFSFSLLNAPFWRLVSGKPKDDNWNARATGDAGEETQNSDGDHFFLLAGGIGCAAESIGILLASIAID